MLASKHRLRSSAVFILAVRIFVASGGTAGAADSEWANNPWRDASGTLAVGSMLITLTPPVGDPMPIASLPDLCNVCTMEPTVWEQGPLAMFPAEPVRKTTIADLPLAPPRNQRRPPVQAVGGAVTQEPVAPLFGDAEPFTTYEAMGSRRLRVAPRDEYNSMAGGDARAMNDRGIDSADTKWRRQARLTGVRMRMLNGPEFAYATDGYNSDTERGSRNYAGAVVPLNNRWELAALNNFSSFKMKEGGGHAGIDALTLRLGANPSVSFRPWVAVTPYTGLWESDSVGLGLSGGLSKTWASGMALSGEAYAWEPWDEGYETARQDGRSYGMRIAGTMPVDRRLTLNAGVEYEWLELGPHAPGGRQYAGRRGGWDVRADYLLLKRDGAFMGYGFREQTLWNEQLVPVELGVFAELSWERYIRPRNFEALNPTRKSFRQRIGLFYNQAISPHLGFNSEAYVGQDPRRGVGPGELYGLNLRLNVVVNTRLRMWCGWGYESTTNTLEGGGGPDRNLSFGLNCNF